MQKAVPLVGLFDVAQRVLLPLKSCTVNAEVQGYIVGLKSVLKYVNGGDKPVEVQFRFPVEESYAVVGMEAVIEGRTIKAEIKKKEEAKKDYKEAIASGHTAALAEEQSGDILSISLGNLSAGSEAELHLKLVGELPIDAEGGVRFTLPAVLKPRYTPEGSVDPLAPAAGTKKGEAPAVYDFKMSLKSDEVADVTSPTHAISVDKDADKVCVSLSGEDAQPLKKDLVVLISHKDSHVPRVVYELGDPTKSQRSYMGAPAVMLSFFPEFEVKRAACEFIFLVDRSGSMRGSYIKSASETLVLFLKSIPPGCSFNIIGFGSSYTSLFPESVSYNQESLQDAIRHAESLQADLGGTELLSPLKHIFDQRLLPGLPRQIFVLTDGSVSNTQLCINEVKKNVHKCRVFTFGIGSGASTALVNGIAKAGNGTSEFIKEGERMQPKVIGSLKKALQPSVTDLKLEFDLPSGFEAFQAPSNIPTLFKGDKVVIYGILKTKAASDSPLQSGVRGKASLKGQISEKAIAHSISFDIPAPPLMGEDQLESSTGFDLPVIHHLAAKSLLSDWKAGKGWGSTALTLEREQESINISIESSVICEHTAFVAVDQEKKQPIEGAITMYDLTASMTEESYQLGLRKGRGMARSRGGTGRGVPPRGVEVLACAPAPRLASSKCKKKKAGNILIFDSLSKESALECSPEIATQPRSSRRTRSSAAASTSDSLMILISLQHAAGYWLLKDLSEKVVKKSLTELQCSTGLSQEVWATVLALVFLEQKCGHQKDEWELIAAKAEMWLSSQSLPSSLESLKDNAKTFV